MGSPRLKNGPALTNESPPAHERTRDLLRELVRAAHKDPAVATAEELLPDAELLLLDINLDGQRYLLIRTQQKAPQSATLSPREHEIARMIARGYSNKTIADVLEISTWTVDTHLRRIFAKMGVRTRAAMVAKMLEENPSEESERGKMKTAHK